MKQKELYAAPATEVLELRLEGTVLTGSDPEQKTPNTTSEWGWDTE